MKDRDDPQPVVATEAALKAIRRLRAAVGPLMFFQSGGCCDGSVPMCFRDGEFVLADWDLLLGTLNGCPFYIDPRQFEAWKAPLLTLDVEPGLPEGFSLPAGDDAHFVTRSRMRPPDAGADPRQDKRVGEAEIPESRVRV